MALSCFAFLRWSAPIQAREELPMQRSLDALCAAGATLGSSTVCFLLFEARGLA